MNGERYACYRHTFPLDSSVLRSRPDDLNNITVNNLLLVQRANYIRKPGLTVFDLDFGTRSLHTFINLRLLIRKRST